MDVGKGDLIKWLIVVKGVKTKGEPAKVIFNDIKKEDCTIM